MMRLTAYALGSVALAAGVLVKAVNERANFYSACIYLSQSNACITILVNLLVLTVGATVFGLQRLLYGPLRPVEAEQLYDKAWFAITETCLAMTVFREEIGVWFIVLFISLLVGKVWAWIGEGRVEIFDQQPPPNPHLFHVRLSASLLLSLVFDLTLLNHSISTVRRQAKPNMMVMFAFEFAVLVTGSTSTALRYLISLREAAIIKRRTKERLAELRNQRVLERAQNGIPEPANQDSFTNAETDEVDIEPPEWEDKSRWILYLELLTDLVRLILYLVFFIVLCVFYGMPLHIIRDVAIALRSFHKRLTDFVKYKHATRDMNERYADAMPDDIGDSDVCIICREAMRPWQENQRLEDQRLRPKKLPCGHILHLGCLRRWLQWQQNCPTCRQPVLSEDSSSGGRSTDGLQQENAPEAPANAHVTEAGLGPENVQAIQQEQQPQAVAVNPVGPGRQEARQGPARENGWRRFQLGPLVLEIGAWHGVRVPENLVRNDRDDVNRTNHRNELTSPDATDINHQDLRLSTPVVRETILRNQIDAIELDILGKINDLRSSLDELAGLHAVIRERISLREDTSASVEPSMHVYSNDRARTPIEAGSSDLPNGLVIPSGWTLVPMNRMNRGSNDYGELQVPQDRTIYVDRTPSGSHSATPFSSMASSMQATSASPNVTLATSQDHSTNEGVFASPQVSGFHMAEPVAATTPSSMETSGPVARQSSQHSYETNASEPVLNSSSLVASSHDIGQDDQGTSAQQVDIADTESSDNSTYAVSNSRQD